MTQPTFSISLIRELRGSPLTVLIAILLLEQSGQVPVTAQALKDATGYKDHTVTDSLRTLENPTRQLITRVNGGWRMTTAFQLPLTFEPGETQNRDIRGFALSSCSSSNRKSKKLLEEEEEERTEIRDIRGFDTFRANYKKAISLNIRDPKASLIAALPHVTPEYIQAHVDLARDDGHPLGTAIYRIIANWSIEINEKKESQRTKAKIAAQVTGHKPNCDCTDCTMFRFGAGLCPDCHHYHCECETEETT